MPDTTTNLSLPYIAAAQAQKHVTVNESLSRLDRLVQLAVVSATTFAQPASPADGQAYILPAGKTGSAWGGMTNLSIAYYRDGAWEQITPREGWLAWIADTDSAAVYAGAGWAALPGAPNAFNNGDFQIWQRGTSFSATGYSADQWRFELNGDDTGILTRQDFTPGQTDVPSEPAFFARAAVTGVNSGTNNSALRHRIEGWRRLAGRVVTLSFYARRAAGAGDLGFECAQVFGSGGSPSSIISAIAVRKFTLSTAWQRITHTFTIPSIAGKSFGTNNDDFLQICVWLSAASALDARSGGLGAQIVTVDFADLRLDLGPFAAPFERRPRGEELACCRRYYQVKTIRSENGARHVPLFPAMRAAPSVTVDIGAAGNVTAEGFELTHTGAADCTASASAEL